MAQLIEKASVFLPALLLLVGGLVVGLVLEKVILAKLKRIAGKTSWKGDNIVIDGLHGMVLLWSVIAGAHAAIFYLPLSAPLFSFLQKGLVVLTIFTVTVVVARNATGFINLYSCMTVGLLPSISIVSNILKLVIYVVGLLVIFQTLGISIAPILTALGVGGLAVALALKDTLANLFAGLHILFSRQIKPGDYIKLNTGEEGYVMDITWRNTTVRTLPNNLVIIPNTNLASASITNFHLPEVDVVVRVQVGVSYDSDLEKVEKAAFDVAGEVMKEIGVADTEPKIRFQEFGDSSINFVAVMRAREFADQYTLAHEFIKRLTQRFRREGIEIPFPIRTVHLRQQG